MKKMIAAAAMLFCLLVSSCGGSTDGNEGLSTELPSNDPDNYIYEEKDGELTITGYSGIDKSLSIPQEIDGKPVTAVAENAFRGFLYLEKVVIPDSVKVIDGAFVACTDLKYVYIGKGVTSMEDAFRGCTSLKTASGGFNAENIDRAFYGCTSLENGMISDTVKSAVSAFYGCTSLQNVSVKSGITALDHTFEGCTSLSSVALPESVTRLDSAFSGCVSLVSVIGLENVTVLNSAFYGCSTLEELTLGDGITKMNGAFVGCRFLHTVNNLPRSVDSYTASYTGCASLKEAVVPEISDSEALFDYTPSADFDGCISLEKIEILAEYPIREGFCTAFAGLSSLREVYFPDSALELLLRITYTFTDSIYTGSDKKVKAAVTKYKKESNVRITDDYAVIDGKNYSHIYGGDTYEFDPQKTASAADISTFETFTKSSYWCGFPTGGNRKSELVAIERTYSFFLRTTGMNDGLLPDTVTVNGIVCTVGE